jgi:hypothetical protein
MITLSTAFIIWGIISYIRIKKICNQKNEEFNPFEGSFVDFLGIAIGTAMSIIVIFVLSACFLP